MFWTLFPFGIVALFIAATYATAWALDDGQRPPAAATKVIYLKRRRRRPAAAKKVPKGDLALIRRASLLR